MVQEKQPDYVSAQPGTVSWEELSPEEKMDRRFAAWLAAERIKFVSADAEADNRRRHRPWCEG